MEHVKKDAGEGDDCSYHTDDDDSE